MPNRNCLPCLLLIVTVSLAGCSAVRVQSTSVLEFRSRVVPILEARCAIACHGVEASLYEQFMRDPVNSKAFYFPIDPMTGKVPQTEEALNATFQVATRTEDEGPLEYGEAAEFSPLLRVPLAEEFGGLPHRGMDIFAGTDDPDYQRLLHWVELELASRPEIHPELPDNVDYFRKNVLGVFERNGCFLSSCHGPDVFNDFKVVPPLPRSQEHPEITDRFSRRMVLHNREQALGTVTRFANLGGDLSRSRLIVKNLPLSEGGVHQRGGNNQFFESTEDPDVKILLNWLRKEREALRVSSEGGELPKEELGRLRGVAFIRSPRHSPRRFLETEPYWPGSDIYLARTDVSDPPTPLNITAGLHPEGPVEIQSLDIRYDARAVVFSMRSSPDRGFRLYQLELNPDLSYRKNSFRQLSFDPLTTEQGDLIHHLDPVYIPGPHKETELDDVAIAYASNKAGEYSASDSWAVLGEAEDFKDPRYLLDTQRAEAAGTFTGRRLWILEGPEEGSWRTILDHQENPSGGSRFLLDRPLRAPADRRTIYTIEKRESRYRPSYDIWRMLPHGEDPKATYRQTARRMTFTSAQDRHPTVRTTGEVMFTSLRNIGYQANRPVFNGAIYRVQAGGFDYHIQGGNRSRYPLYTDSRELPSGLEVRQALDPRNLWGGGLLILADHGFGVNIEPDNPVDNLALGPRGDDFQASIQRFLPAQNPLFPETGAVAVTVTGLSKGGSFRDPYPLPDGRILVSRVEQTVDHLDPNSDPDWNLAMLSFPRSLQTPEGGAGEVKLETLPWASSPEWAETSPRPLVVRLKEKTHTHQKFATRNDDLEPVEDYGVKRMPEGTPAVVECYDYPLLQSFLTNFAPVGARDFQTGNDPDHSLAYVRILMQEPLKAQDVEPTGAQDPHATPVSLGVHTAKRIVVEHPLEDDGSFYAEVPTGTPLVVQGLNRDRMAMHSMNRWFYLQPGEKLTFSIPRTIFPLRCAGCHGALTGDRVDALGPPDLVSASSRVMANWDASRQAKRKPAGSGKSKKDYTTVDFRRDVQPILDGHCVSCHGGEQVAAGLDLRGTPTEHYSVSYEALHRLEEPASGDHSRKRYVNEREAMALESYLIERLVGRELDAPQAVPQPPQPHPAQAPLSQEDVRTIIRWIDMGATFRGGGD